MATIKKNSTYTKEQIKKDKAYFKDQFEKDLNHMFG